MPETLTEMQKIERAVAQRFHELDKNDPNYIYQVQGIRAYESVMTDAIYHEGDTYTILTSAIEARTSSRCLAIVLERQDRIEAKLNRAISLMKTISTTIAAIGAVGVFIFLST